MENLIKIVLSKDGAVSEMNGFEDSIEIKELDEILGKCGSGFKASEAFINSNGSSASPNIVIENSTVWIYHGQQSGGKVTGTSLIGAGGNYTFTKSGKFSINPGSYKHFVNGTIINSGWIGSGICYK